MASTFIESLPEQIGSLNSDALRAGAYQITYALDGNDTITAVTGGDYNVMVGGKGNDTYVAAYNSAITILDSGGHDRVIATGMGVNNPYTYFGTVDGSHLLAFDLISGQQVMIANWMSSSSRIEEVQLSDGIFSLSQILSFMSGSPNYLGNLSTSQLVNEGMLPAGTTSADLHNLITHFSLREAELTQLASTPVPPPQPVVPPVANVEGLDDAFYLASNPDVAASGVSADEHFSNHGWREGRNPNDWFDIAWYLQKNPDVAAADLNPLLHFQDHGWKEGRDSISWMDVDWYLQQNTDVAASGINPSAHYATFGWKEGRDSNAWMDTDWYLQQNPDVAAAGINPSAHYYNLGWAEGRSPSSAFDTGAYLNANPDVALVGINPLEHWIDFGQAEGRSIA
ncbi:hypothetical protein EKL30_09835 [Candidimonas sp. SYP-B2681]|uniref:hypothetical protein n=1 Tax=Candidimonas sp. SYP-B2681 TaxID=2497686 RepID=UPI000F86FC1D|nr:hypothetical protein [Candidimonas sp. SYP-B2681]RTZ43176.1 hypothetical protein EKL30_09835 [Candidimonas sp. SYP-B2681]